MGSFLELTHTQLQKHVPLKVLSLQQVLINELHSNTLGTPGYKILEVAFTVAQLGIA